MIVFAGFEFPRSLYFLPDTKLSPGDRLRKRAEMRKHVGPYYTNKPCPNIDGRMFYLESDFMPGLRWQWCDEVNGVRIRHTGWFTDQHCDGTIRGLVMRLPHSRGFIAGWSMGESMASEIEYYVYDDEVDAAHAADSMAQHAAERQREYEEQEEEQ